MEGLLRKLNSKGLWKDRVTVLNGTHFTTYKLKVSQKNEDIKEHIALHSIRFVGVQDGVLKITTVDDVEHIFKSENIHHWLSAIQFGIKQANEISLVDSILSSNAVKHERVNINGVLKKKSHNKLIGFQV
jgi:hypothetical protein